MKTPRPRDPRRAPRRFLLLAEEALERDVRRPRVRRYLLSTLPSRGALQGVGVGRPGTAHSLELTGRV